MYRSDDFDHGIGRRQARSDAGGGIFAKLTATRFPTRVPDVRDSQSATPPIHIAASPAKTAIDAILRPAKATV